MQRQSLGSPGSKHHHHNNNNGGSSRDDNACVSKADDRRDSLSTSSSSSSSSPSPIVVVADEEEMKFEKAIRCGSNVRMERIVHAIPILTLLCFLVLYLCSHKPSDSVLSQFGVLKPALKPIEFGVDSSNEMDDIIGGYLGKESGAGEVIGIRSHRNLQEIVKENPKPRSNRKFVDF